MKRIHVPGFGLWSAALFVVLLMLNAYAYH